MEELSIDCIRLGEWVRSHDEIEVTAEDIIDFAQAFDPQPWHLSSTMAQNTPFGSLAASGWHTAALTMRLIVGMGLTGLIGKKTTLNWPTPTRPGDRLHVNLKVIDIRDSQTKPNLQVITIEYLTLNQTNEVRQETHATVLKVKQGDDDLIGSSLV